MKKKATFNMDEDLHEDLKVWAARQHRPMVELVQDAIRAYLGDLEVRDLELRANQYRPAIAQNAAAPDHKP